MADYIEAPTMGEILREEYMIPMGITAARLGNCFGVSEQYFLNLQNAIDSRRTIH